MYVDNESFAFVVESPEEVRSLKSLSFPRRESLHTSERAPPAPPPAVPYHFDSSRKGGGDTASGGAPCECRTPVPLSSPPPAPGSSSFSGSVNVSERGGNLAQRKVSPPPVPSPRTLPSSAGGGVHRPPLRGPAHPTAFNNHITNHTVPHPQPPAPSSGKPTGTKMRIATTPTTPPQMSTNGTHYSQASSSPFPPPPPGPGPEPLPLPHLSSSSPSPPGPPLGVGGVKRMISFKKIPSTSSLGEAGHSDTDSIAFAFTDASLGGGSFSTFPAGAGAGVGGGGGGGTVGGGGGAPLFHPHSHPTPPRPPPSPSHGGGGFPPPAPAGTAGASSSLQLHPSYSPQKKSQQPHINSRRMSGSLMSNRSFQFQFMDSFRGSATGMGGGGEEEEEEEAGGERAHQGARLGHSPPGVNHIPSSSSHLNPRGTTPSTSLSGASGGPGVVSPRRWSLNDGGADTSGEEYRHSNETHHNHRHNNNSRKGGGGGGGGFRSPSLDMESFGFVMEDDHFISPREDDPSSSSNAARSMRRSSRRGAGSAGAVPTTNAHKLNNSDLDRRITAADSRFLQCLSSSDIRLRRHSELVRPSTSQSLFEFDEESFQLFEDDGQEEEEEGDAHRRGGEAERQGRMLSCRRYSSMTPHSGGRRESYSRDTHPRLMMYTPKILMPVPHSTPTTTAATNRSIHNHQNTTIKNNSSRKKKRKWGSTGSEEEEKRRAMGRPFVSPPARRFSIPRRGGGREEKELDRLSSVENSFQDLHSLSPGSVDWRDFKFGDDHGGGKGRQHEEEEEDQSSIAFQFESVVLPPSGGSGHQRADPSRPFLPQAAPSSSAADAHGNLAPPVAIPDSMESSTSLFQLVSVSERKEEGINRGDKEEANARRFRSATDGVGGDDSKGVKEKKTVISVRLRQGTPLISPSSGDKGSTNRKKQSRGEAGGRAVAATAASGQEEEEDRDDPGRYSYDRKADESPLLEGGGAHSALLPLSSAGLSRPPPPPPSAAAAAAGLSSSLSSGSPFFASSGTRDSTPLRSNSSISNDNTNNHHHRASDHRGNAVNTLSAKKMGEDGVDLEVEHRSSSCSAVMYPLHKRVSTKVFCAPPPTPSSATTTPKKKAVTAEDHRGNAVPTTTTTSKTNNHNNNSNVNFKKKRDQDPARQGKNHPRHPGDSCMTSMSTSHPKTSQNNHNVNHHAYPVGNAQETTTRSRTSGGKRGNNMKVIYEEAVRETEDWQTFNEKQNEELGQLKKRVQLEIAGQSGGEGADDAKEEEEKERNSHGCFSPLNRKDSDPGKTQRRKSRTRSPHEPHSADSIMLTGRNNHHGGGDGVLDFEQEEEGEGEKDEGRQQEKIKRKVTAAMTATPPPPSTSDLEAILVALYGKLGDHKKKRGGRGGRQKVSTSRSHDYYDDNEDDEDDYYCGSRCSTDPLLQIRDGCYASGAAARRKGGGEEGRMAAGAAGAAASGGRKRSEGGSGKMWKQKKEGKGMGTNISPLPIASTATSPKRAEKTETAPAETSGPRELLRDAFTTLLPSAAPPPLSPSPSHLSSPRFLTRTTAKQSNKGGNAFYSSSLTEAEEVVASLFGILWPPPPSPPPSSSHSIHRDGSRSRMTSTMTPTDRRDGERDRVEASKNVEGRVRKSPMTVGSSSSTTMMITPTNARVAVPLACPSSRIHGGRAGGYGRSFSRIRQSPVDGKGGAGHPSWAQTSLTKLRDDASCLSSVPLSPSLHHLPPPPSPSPSDSGRKHATKHLIAWGRGRTATASKEVEEEQDGEKNISVDHRDDPRRCFPSVSSPSLSPCDMYPALYFLNGRRLTPAQTREFAAMVAKQEAASRAQRCLRKGDVAQDCSRGPPSVRVHPDHSTSPLPFHPSSSSPSSTRLPLSLFHQNSTEKTKNGPSPFSAFHVGENTVKHSSPFHYDVGGPCPSPFSVHPTERSARPGGRMTTTTTEPIIKFSTCSRSQVLREVFDVINIQREGKLKMELLPIIHQILEKDLGLMDRELTAVGSCLFEEQLPAPLSVLNAYKYPIREEDLLSSDRGGRRRSGGAISSSSSSSSLPSSSPTSAVSFLAGVRSNTLLPPPSTPSAKAYVKEWEELLGYIQLYYEKRHEEEAALAKMEKNLLRTTPQLHGWIGRGGMEGAPLLDANPQESDSSVEGEEDNRSLNKYSSASATSTYLNHPSNVMVWRMILSARQNYEYQRQREWERVLPLLQFKFLHLRRRTVLVSFAVNVVLPLCLGAGMGDLDFAGVASLILLVADGKGGKRQQARARTSRMNGGGGHGDDNPRTGTQMAPNVLESVLQSYFDVLCRVPRSG